MLLKEKQTNGTFLNNSLSFFKKKKFLVGVVIFFLYTILVLGVGYVLKRNDFYGLIFKPAITKNYRGVVDYLKSFSVNPEQIIIDIKHKDYLKLAYKRQEALKVGRLYYSPEEDWVPAILSHHGKAVKANIRLKGVYDDHWKDESAWSFKVKIKDDNTLLGMKRFALQGPWTRNFMNEWYWHKLLRYSGLIALRYNFVDLTVNGKNLAIYAIEENFDKRLIENNHLREGPIFWANVAPWMAINEGPKFWVGLAPFLTLKAINVYQSSKYLQNADFMKLIQTAESRVEAYRQGNLPFSQVFDVNKMGKLLALTDLVGNYHTLALTNTRYYFNPVTGLIEPIAYDNNNINPLSKLSFIGAGRRFVEQKHKDLHWEWPVAAFRDKLLFKKYVESLTEVSSTGFLDQFFLEVEGEAQEKLKLLHRSYPFYEFKNKEIFYKNQEYIRKQLLPQKSLNVYFDGVVEGEGVLNLDIANIHPLPVEVLGVSLDNDNILKPLHKTIVQAKKIKRKENLFRYPNRLIPALQNVTETVLKEVNILVSLLPMVSTGEQKIKQQPQNKVLSGLTYEAVKFRIPDGLKWSNDLIPRLRVISRVFGASMKTFNTIIPWARHEDLFLQPNNIKEISFMSIEEEKKFIRIKPGKWVVNQDIIIPAGYRVIVGYGTHLNFSNQAKILSYSALEFIGSEEQPIIISSKASSGQGIIVMQATDKSIMQYVTFDGLSSPNRGGWALTGAVNFYESPVEFSNVIFTNNRSEDALNIIRSEFNLKNVVFRNISSDALDADFSNGIVKNVSFFNCGNDALDVSGSEIRVESIFWNGIGDKGISVGEKSKVFIDKLEGKNARIAIASKDESKVFIKDAKVESSQIGFTAFQKKSEFGPGAIEVQALEMNDLETPFLIEEGSTLKIDGVPIAARFKDVGRILYGG